MRESKSQDLTQKTESRKEDSLTSVGDEVQNGKPNAKIQLKNAIIKSHIHQHN
jgi:hypothetical protein